MTSPTIPQPTPAAAWERPAPLLGPADPPPGLGRLGDLEVRLAAGRDDLRRRRA